MLAFCRICNHCSRLRKLGRILKKDMTSIIVAALFSFVFLVFKTTAGEDASVVTAAKSQPIRWHKALLPRGIAQTYNPGNTTESNYYGLGYRELEMCKEIPFVSRKKWGARQPNAVESFSIDGGVSYVFYHHTEGEDCFSKEHCSEIILKWQAVHQDVQGWDDIGYNFLIGGSGLVFEGRGWNKVGAHTVGFNNKSVSLGFVGDYSHKVPNIHMLEAAQNLIECGIKLNKISDGYTLHGQRDANCRTCPGEVFYAFMKNMSHFGGKLQDYICTRSPWE